MDGAEKRSPSSQQKNTFDCGVYVLGFAEKILQNIQGFIEAIDGGKELGWEFDGQTLRDHIKDNLYLAADAEELIDEIAKLQARGSPLVDKPETLKYIKFLGGLVLPLPQQKLKTPHDGVATSIEPPTSLSEAYPLLARTAGPEDVDMVDVKDTEGSSTVLLSPLVHSPDADEVGCREVISNSCKPDNLAADRSYKALRDVDLPTVHHTQPAQVPEQVSPALTATSGADHAANNASVERHHSEPPRKRRREIIGQTIPHPECLYDSMRAAVLMASEAVPHPKSRQVRGGSGRAETSPSERVSGIGRDSYILNELQAKWATTHHGLEVFNIINLETALDCNGRYGSCITFTVSEEAANNLATCRGEGPNEPSEVRGVCTQITQDGVQVALNQLSSCHMVIPSRPYPPFISLWITLDLGRNIAKTYGVTS